MCLVPVINTLSHIARTDRCSLRSTQTTIQITIGFRKFCGSRFYVFGSCHKYAQPCRPNRSLLSSQHSDNNTNYNRLPQVRRMRSFYVLCSAILSEPAVGPLTGLLKNSRERLSRASPVRVRRRPLFSCVAGRTRQYGRSSVRAVTDRGYWQESRRPCTSKRRRLLKAGGA